MDVSIEIAVSKFWEGIPGNVTQNTSVNNETIFLNLFFMAQA